jgi:beta-galactosidase/beta-glucuronidase
MQLRFGFREITWAKAKLYLNGEELYLRGNGDHPLGDMEGGKPFAEAMIRKLKSLGVQCMRMHNLPRHQELYEAGDELGFMYFSEASHHFRLPEPEVGKAHMARLVKYLRNHPCVLAWSVSNELHWRKIEEPKYLIDVCRENDPTRPAFASDFTPWSLHGDLVSHHYCRR